MYSSIVARNEGGACSVQHISYEKLCVGISKSISVSSTRKKPDSVLETENSSQARDLCNTHKSQQDFQPTERRKTK